MLLNLFVVLVAAAVLWLVQKKIDLEPLPRLVFSIAIVVSVLGWLIVGAAPR